MATLRNSVSEILQHIDRRDLVVAGDDRGDALVDFSIFNKVSNAAIEVAHEIVRSQEVPSVVDRCCGAMIGMAIGDAIGAPLEFMDAVDESGAGMAAFELTEARYTGRPYNAHNLKAGQWTDDCSMGLCLADSLIVHSCFNGSDVNARFWCWCRNGYNNCFKHESDESRAGENAEFYKEAMIPIRESIGAGGGVKRALGSLRKGEPPPVAIELETQEDGNAALIRLAPVPIFCCHSEIQDCIEMARLSAKTTSGGSIVAEAVAFMAFAMHRALNIAVDDGIFGSLASAQTPIQAFLDNIVHDYHKLLLESSDPSAADLLRLLAASEPTESTELCWNWRDSRLEIIQTLQNRGNRYNGFPVSRKYFGSFSMDGLAVALWALYNSTSATSAVVMAANLLGDADSIACITGQIAGAFYGARAFDERLVGQVQQWDPRSEIILRGILLHDKGQS